MISKINENICMEIRLDLQPNLQFLQFNNTIFSYALQLLCLSNCTTFSHSGLLSSSYHMKLTDERRGAGCPYFTVAVNVKWLIYCMQSVNLFSMFDRNKA